MKAITVALTTLITVLLADCSKSPTENAHPAAFEVAAILSVIPNYDGPIIVATARIPLDETRTTNCFIAIDGNSLYGDRYQDMLPVKPTNARYRFGIARDPVPLESLDEDINRQALEATEKKDTASLERIAKSLTGRVSFYYEPTKDAYNDD